MLEMSLSWRRGWDFATEPSGVAYWGIFKHFGFSGVFLKATQNKCKRKGIENGENEEE